MVIIITRRIPTESASRRVHKSLTGMFDSRGRRYSDQWVFEWNGFECVCGRTSDVIFFRFYNLFVSCFERGVLIYPPTSPIIICRTKPRPLEPTRFFHSLANGEISSKQQHVIVYNSPYCMVESKNAEFDRPPPFVFFYSSLLHIFHMLKTFRIDDVFRVCPRKYRDNRDTYV